MAGTEATKLQFDGTELRRYRTELLDWTQDKLCERAKISRPYLSEMENHGQARPRHLDKVIDAINQEISRLRGLGRSVGELTYVSLKLRSSSEPGELGNSEPCAKTQILDAGVIRVGVFRYPPLIDYHHQGEQIVVTGLYASMMKSFARNAELGVTWVPLNIGDSIQAIKSRSVDIVLCIFQTAQRARHADFTAFLHSVTVGGVTLRSQDTVRTESDLRKDSVIVAVSRGEIGHELAQCTYDVPTWRLKELNSPDVSDVVSLVEVGEADIAIADNLSIARYIERRPHEALSDLDATFVDNPLLICQNGIMLPPGQRSLYSWLNGGFRAIRDETSVVEEEQAILNAYGHIVRRL